MISAVFRAEFLRALPVWPWLLTAHVLSAIAAIIPWNATHRAAGSPVVVRTDLLGTVAGWSVGALSLFLIVRSLWEENPNRSGNFIATRPVRIPALIKGKTAGLFILILVPFLVAEAGILLGRGQPVPVLGMGLLEALVILLVLMAVAFALVWCWSKRSQAYAGLLLALGMIAATAALLDRVVPSMKFSDSLYYWQKLGSLPALLCGLLVLGVAAACCALVFRRARTFRRGIAFAILASLLVPVVMIRLARIRQETGKPFHASLAHLTLSNREIGDRVANWVEIEPPKPPLPENTDLVWSVDSLKVNGDRATPTSQQRVSDRLRMPSRSWDARSIPPLRAALREHFGNKINLGKFEKEKVDFPAQTAIPGDHDSARALDLEMKLHGNLITWQVVADLPVTRQAEARRENTRWTVASVMQADDFLRIQLVETAPYLWLLDLKDRQLFNENCDRYFLIREADGKVEKVGGYSRSGWQRTSLSLRERETSISYSSGDFVNGHEPDPFLVPGSAYRLVIIRGVPSGDLTMDWRTPSPISCANLWTPNKSYGPPPTDPRAGTAMQWLQTHPVPAKGASDEVVGAWLDEFIPRIGDHLYPNQIRLLVVPVGRLMTEHTDAVIRKARDLPAYSSGARAVFAWAVMDHLPREYARTMKAWDFDEEIYKRAVEKGWQGDLTDMAVQRARMGFGWQVEEALLASPKETGFSKTEWHDFFRLYPTADAFHAMADAVLPREELEKEVDGLLEDIGFRPANPYIDPLLNLALARGRREAPRWLRDYRKQANGEPVESFRLKDPIRKWFEVPGNLKTDDEAVAWFLSHDPDRFIFDPASGKFQLR